jgi:hypothetical protein
VKENIMTPVPRNVEDVISVLCDQQGHTVVALVLARVLRQESQTLLRSHTDPIEEWGPQPNNPDVRAKARGYREIARAVEDAVEGFLKEFG